MVLFAVLGLSAWAQSGASADEPEDFSEVVLVWPDKFKRWQNTRWWVGMELLYPPGLSMAATENKQFRTIALQVRAVLACDQSHKLGRKKIEVDCVIEDIALRATSVRRFKRESDRRLVQDVLDDLDASLTGASIQLQVNDRGAIVDVGLEQIDRSNRRLRLRAETMRQILQRLIYPFHMKLPKSGMREGQWVEYDSDLMTMPAATASQGHSMIVHYMNFYEGYLLVQDIGTGIVSVETPPPPAQIGSSTRREIDIQTASGSSTDPTSFNAAELFSRVAGDGGEFDRRTVGAPTSYKLHMDGVSIYNLDNGVMEERVWSIIGRPNAFSPSNLKLWYSGKIRLLGPKEKPDLGPTEQIGYPGIPIEGLPPWTPVDPQMSTEHPTEQDRG